MMVRTGFDEWYDEARKKMIGWLTFSQCEAAWQASRAAALDEAVKEVVKLADEAREDMALEDDYRFGVYAKKYDKAACHIRALKD